MECVVYFKSIFLRVSALLKATSICMNCVVVCVCICNYKNTRSEALSTCKSDQKFKLKLTFLPNAVASNDAGDDDDDDDDICNSPASPFFRPLPWAPGHRKYGRTEA